jgi:hypothetical protein
VAVAGNKDDLSEKEAVDIVQVKQYVKENDFLYARTSAKEDTGIKTLFINLAKRLNPTMFEG